MYLSNRYEIERQSTIIQIVRKDNSNGNTFHFQWDRAPFNHDYILIVMTHNVRTKENFLLKEVSAPTKAECWDLMIDYVTNKFKEENNYVITWKSEDGDIIESYFRASTEVEAQLKFGLDCNGKYLSIELKPIS